MAFVPIAMMAYDVVVDNIYYNLDNQSYTATVTRHGSGPYGYEDDVVIPGTFSCNGQNYTVTSIEESAFSECLYLTSVVIPSSVKSIGDNAFSLCPRLTSVTIPVGVETIGMSAFEYCAIQSVTIPNTVKSIGESAFFGCTSLTSINIPSSVKSIMDFTFGECNKLSTVTISEGVETIGISAFEDCFALQSITIPSTVTSIGEDAFKFGDSNKADALEYIGVAARNGKYDSRSNCNAIIEKSTKKLILGCKNTVIPEDVTSIAKNAFMCRDISTVFIPVSVTTIEEAAFSDCKNLYTVYIYNNSISVSNDAFRNVGKSVNCKLYVSKTFDFGDYSVSGDKTLWKAGSFNLERLPYDIELNGVYYNLDEDSKTASVSRKDNTNIPYSGEVVIPGTITYNGQNYRVTSIEDGAFAYSPDMYYVIIPEGLETIGMDAFRDCFSLRSINIPSSVTSIGKDAFRWDSPNRTDYFETITVAEGNTVYDSRGNCNAIIETASNTLICGCMKTVIPEGVKTIAEDAFKSRYISSVIIPSSVTEIENGAFSYCSKLTSVTIYSSSVSLINRSFNGVGTYNAGVCNLYVPRRFDLGDYTVSDDKIKWQGGTFILNRLPYDIALDGIYYTLDDDLKEAIVMYNNNDFQPSYSGDVKIPESITYNGVSYDVTTINSSAFYDCVDLTSVFIPSSVRNIESRAFKGCSKLASLIFFGNKPNIGEKAFEGVGTNDNPCKVYVPEGFDFESVDTSGNSFLWYEGYFSLESLKISISEAGMATYCSPYDLDFTNVTGLKAYIITGYDWVNRKVYATRVYDVPAGTGLYLVGKPGDYTLEMGNTGSYYINMLVGTLVETWIEPTDGDLTNLRLTGSSAQDASFKTFTAPRTFSANRAYLQIPTAVLDHSANAVGIVFDDEADRIEGISQNARETDNNWFTLDGRKLNGKPTTKGVYVVKGKKVVVK